jgi:hypothetical protein
MSNGSRILTTHVGSLPRPQDVVDVVSAIRPTPASTSCPTAR